ncbi:Uncharacterised protein [Mycobacterium tuberculosis]|nr:Uncharacterised protein [Mycobacterium tuberculosis]
MVFDQFGCELVGHALHAREMRGGGNEIGDPDTRIFSENGGRDEVCVRQG